MQEMGIKNTQYIIVRHHNADNEHLHIVYNRIDNNLKLISVNNDYKRNIKACKKLKMTYGKGKDRVKRGKLNDPDKVKYYIHDAIKAVLPTCKTPADLRFALLKFGIEIEYKYKRTTNEIEGVSFRYNNIAFKGSQIDRKFSYGNLQKSFKENIELLQQQSITEPEQQDKTAPKVQKLIDSKPKIRSIGEVKLTSRQWQMLEEAGFIYMENLNKSNGSGKFSAYVFLNDEKDKTFSCKKNPDTFVKYGKYEMRIRDRILIEKGYVIHTKVKWWGGFDFAYPYLWKENKTDIDYKVSWYDPRIPKAKKIQIKPNTSMIQRKNRNPKIIYIFHFER